MSINILSKLFFYFFYYFFFCFVLFCFFFFFFFLFLKFMINAMTLSFDIVKFPFLVGDITNNG